MSYLVPQHMSRVAVEKTMGSMPAIKGNLEDKTEEALELQAQMALLKSKMEALGIKPEPMENLSVPLAVSIKQKLERMCDEKGVKMAVVVRKLITEYVQNNGE